MNRIALALAALASVASLTGCASHSEETSGYPSQPVVTKTVTATPEPVTPSGAPIETYADTIETTVDAAKDSLRQANVSLDGVDKAIAKARKIHRRLKQATPIIEGILR